MLSQRGTWAFKSAKSSCSVSQISPWVQDRRKSSTSKAIAARLIAARLVPHTAKQTRRSMWSSCGAEGWVGSAAPRRWTPTWTLTTVSPKQVAMLAPLRCLLSTFKILPWKRVPAKASYYNIYLYEYIQRNFCISVLFCNQGYSAPGACLRQWVALKLPNKNAWQIFSMWNLMGFRWKKKCYALLPLDKGFYGIRPDSPIKNKVSRHDPCAVTFGLCFFVSLVLSSFLSRCHLVVALTPLTNRAERERQRKTNESVSRQTKAFQVQLLRQRKRFKTTKAFQDKRKRFKCSC